MGFTIFSVLCRNWNLDEARAAVECLNEKLCIDEAGLGLKIELVDNRPFQDLEAEVDVADVQSKDALGQLLSEQGVCIRRRS